MVLIDPRDGGKVLKPGEEGTSDKLVRYIRALSIPCEKSRIEYGDACFEGNGPQGTIAIGIERKTIHDMIDCIRNGRLNEQRIGMKGMYDKKYVMLEGRWKSHDENFRLMEAFGENTYGFYKGGGSGAMYAELFNFILSLDLVGVTVTPSRNLWHTAFNIVCMYWYFQKKWTDHTSMLEMHPLAIPSLNGPPSLVRMWAAALNGVGVKYSGEAERLFKSGRRLANSDELDWIRIGNIGAGTAQKIIKQIGGR